MGQISNPSQVLSGFQVVDNTENGRTLILTPQNRTGLNENAANWIIDTTTGEFTGNLYNDPVIAVGYNVSGNLGVLNPALDPAAMGLWFENDYGHETGFNGVSTAGTATTLTDAAATWGPNAFEDWTLYNVTTDGRGLITSNTVTAVTCAGGMVTQDGVTTAPPNAAGHAYQVQRRDMEFYLQLGFNTGSYYAFRPIFQTFDRSSATGRNGDTVKAMTAASNANPAQITVPGHQLKAGDWFKFSALTGGTWNTQLGGKQAVAVSIVDADNFTIGYNSTGYGAWATGSITIPPVVTASKILISQAAGLQIMMPDWVAADNNNVVATFLPGEFRIHDQGINGPILSLFGRTGVTQAQIQARPSGILTSGFVFGVDANGGTVRLDTYDAAGGNSRMAGIVARRAGNNVWWSLGTGFSNTGFFNLDNDGQDAARIIFAARAHAAQTADMMSLRANGGGVLMAVSAAGLITTASTTLIASNVALTNNAAAAAGTLLNAPVAGNPTKWIPINDNGTIRNIPAW